MGFQWQLDERKENPREMNCGIISFLAETVIKLVDQHDHAHIAIKKPCATRLASMWSRDRLIDFEFGSC